MEASKHHAYQNHSSYNGLLVKKDQTKYISSKGIRSSCINIKYDYEKRFYL